MPLYAYQARARNGQPQQGTIEAPSADEAIALLQTRELLVTSIREGRGAAAPRISAVVRKRMHTAATSSDLVIFARSLATMTEAGLPLLRALETVGLQNRSAKLGTAIQGMTQDMRGGSTFRDAVAKHPAIFDPFWVSLIETGEASGQLTRSLEQIAIHLEKMGSIQAKVISALIYPSILFLVAIGAIFVFTLKIIPTFAGMFASFGAKLPLLTRMVIQFSNLLKQYLLLLVAVAVGLVFLFRNWVKTKPGRWQFDKLKLSLPLFGPLFQGAASEQFASNLGTLLKAGVPILHALEITGSTSSNKVVAGIIEQMRAGVREGRPLIDPLGATDVFPPMVIQMLSVGEQTGKLPEMLGEVADYFEEQVSTAVARMTTLLEPVMLVGMGLVIGVLVLSMYLPIFQMTQVIRG